MSVLDSVELERWTAGSWQGPCRPNDISALQFDSRLVETGDCFVALSVGARDGHDFAQTALERGASALMVERFLDLDVPQLVVGDSLLAMGAIGRGQRDAFRGSVLGITGSCGKTSTKEMLRILLGGDSEVHATAGNWNNRIGVPMTLSGLNASAARFAVIEAGINQPDEMAHLGAMIAADLVVVTNIGAAHLELLGNVDQVAVEKSLLFEHAQSDAKIVLPNAVMQYPAFARFGSRSIVLAEVDEVLLGEPEQVLRYRLTDVGLELYGMEFELASASVGIRQNAALALVAAYECGVGLEALQARLKQWLPDGNRGRIIQTDTQSIYVDCYNANPASMRDAIATFRTVSKTADARCYVLGAMNELGEVAEELHAEVSSELSLESSDCVFLVGPEALTGAYLRGLADVSVPVVVAESVAEIESSVRAFKGAVFLKGSRGYALERLLPV